jgi:hypothetical protein
MEITLKVDDEVEARARAFAAQRETTVEALVSEYLRELDTRSWGERFREFTARHAGRSAPGYRFDREACHDRSAHD